MKRLLLVFVILLTCASLASSQNISGALNGNLGPASYTVVDSIWVAAGETLTLAPGTTFNFAGAFGFGVAGSLHAVGNATDSIKFKPDTGVPFWKGIDITQASSNTTTISYCYITGANTSGIYSNFASPTISHCFITECSDPTYGGGINCYQASSSTATPLVTDNLITNCTSQNGGGFHCRNCTPILRNNVFVGNNGVYGGAMAFYFSVGSITNCLYYGNSGSNAGGGVRFSSCTTTCTNCTFVNNTGGSGSAVYVINQTPTLKNLIAYGNTGHTTKEVYVYAGGLSVSYSCIEDSLWPGTGNMTSNPLFANGPQGAYYLSQVAAGQPVNSPCVDAGDPGSTMIVGTTRTDEVQDASVVDMGYHYSLAAAAPPALDVTLTPLNPPIIVPANGGSFEFIGAVVRTVAPQTPFWVWARIKYPDGSYTPPTVGPVQINPPVNLNVSRQRTQNVPGSWPPGPYTYVGYANPSYSYPAIDSSTFNWTKLTTSDGGPIMWDATCYGEPFPGEVMVSAPATFNLAGAYPNPFNPTTTISFTLPEALLVTLNVYDVSGRLVTTLVNGHREAGQHQFTFDASALSSGIYLYTLQAGSHIATGKMALVK